jgi:hypothetical protein
MGFHDVTDHHGSHESGKDFLMWKPDILSGRENYAVVVKATPITSRNRLEVQDQVLRSFGESYADPISGELRNVDRVLVVSSKKITAPSKTAIHSYLRNQNLSSRCDFIDGYVLAQRVSSFLSRELIWDAFDQARKVLEESFGGVGVGLHLDAAGRRTVYFTEKPGTASTQEPFNVTLSAEDLGIGSDCPVPQAEMRRLLLEGEEVELPAEHLTGIELPSFFQMLVPDGRLTSVVIGPSAVDPPIVLDLDFVGTDGAHFELPYVEFGVKHGWEDTVVVSNRGQPIPFLVKLILDKKSRDRGSIRISWDYKGTPDAVFFHHVSNLRQFLFEGGKITARDARRLAALELTVNPDPASAPPRGAVELSRRLAVIQERIQTPLLVARLDFSDEELVDIIKASEILEHGRFMAEAARIAVDLKQDASIDIEKLRSSSEPVRIQDLENEVVTILDVDIELGSKIVHYSGFRRRVRSNKKRVRIELEASREHPLVLFYPKWRPMRSGV